MPMEGFDSDWDDIYAQDKAYSDDEIAPLRLYKHVSPGFFADRRDANDCGPRTDVD